tara:strand:+ start:291 stop:920 length:630 start_codon:yes stop_codon:yes gene_type:complete
MTRQAITIGTANAKGGDTLNAAFTKVNANETELYADVAANAAAIVANTALISGFTKTYWFITASNASAITHTAGATNTYLTNNGLGSDTSEYNPDSKSPVWNSVTNKFDFTSLKIGDIVNITGKLSFDNLAAQEVDMFISVAEGTASAHEHQINHSYYKTAATGTGFTFTFPFFIEDADERDGGARFRFASAQAASLTIERWSAKVTVV